MDRVHVLLLEDDGALGEVLAEILHEHGLIVRVATARVPPSEVTNVGMILADLPGKPPREIRALAADVSPVPLGLLTTFPATAAELGAAFVLQKPIDIDELLAATATALRLPEVPAVAAQEALVERYFAALAANDWRALAEVVHRDVIYNLPTEAPHGGLVIGRDAFVRHATEVFGQYPAVAFEVDRQLPLPLSRVASYTGSWATPNGRVTLAGHVVFGFEEGAIARVGVHLDAQRLAKLRDGAAP